MTPVIVLLSGTWDISISRQLSLTLCVSKSHDLYHARESPLKLVLLWSKLRATLPEPDGTVKFGGRGGIRNEYSSSNQDGGANGSSFRENGPAA